MENKRGNLSIILTIGWLCSILLLNGCNLEEEPIQSNTEKLIPIDVSVEGIGNWQTGKDISSRSVGDNDTISTCPVKEATGVLNGTAIMHTSGGKSASTFTRGTVGATVRFRVVAYQCGTASAITTSNYADYGDFQITNTSGSAIATKAMALQEGKYTFICYSYGNNNVLPTFDKNVLTLSINQGNDFMTCIKEGVEVITYGKSFQLNNIQFSRRCARLSIRVVADATRMAAITACSATIAGNAATYSFTGNTLVPNGTSSSLAISWPGINSTNVLSNYVYVLPQSAGNLVLKLHLTIGGKSFTNVSATIPSQALSQQTAYECKVSLTTLDYIVGGSVWARGNLRYVSGTYQFYPQTYSYSYVATAGDYWSWNAVYPHPAASASTVWNDANDPCRQVSPQGTWHSPGSSEAGGLANSGYQMRTTLGGVTGVTFGGVLFLPMSGHYAGTGMVDSNARGLYWMKEAGGGTGIFLGFNIENGVVPGWPTAQANLGMCIRCVR